ncbi:hypothetical protein ZIOFF_070387 [Zingiber officinale]|uniref:Uncharacterized protein n=1 Tax=Zingiber officinale TaxID=94328 RepID=A0A8J5EVC0_ZINOF|nr:hypothetical protein ZIOFF_070387 [Zingiber officinale]
MCSPSSTSFSSRQSIVCHGDMVDTLLMTLAFVGAVGDGLSTLAFYMFTRTSTDVNTSITSDILIIQDCFNEKVPNYIMNGATFIACYAVGFFIMWWLAQVASPTMVLLVNPDIMYDRILMELTQMMWRM